MENEQPQTEREWRILFITELKKLSLSVHELSQTVKDFKEREIAEIRKELAELQKFRMGVMSSWKTIVVIITAAASGIALFFKAMFK